MDQSLLPGMLSSFIIFAKTTRYCISRFIIQTKMRKIMHNCYNDKRYICDRCFPNGLSSHCDDINLSQKVTCSRHDTKNIYAYSLSWRKRTIEGVERKTA